jgi:hypothetical protein
MRYRNMAKLVEVTACHNRTYLYESNKDFRNCQTSSISAKKIRRCINVTHI